ncbi:MAG: hypothetical protein E7623_06905 [Ruminococcaceae bacterium]|nr:hypothetical protein [Oscillospiraceae bacterium]
MDKILKYKKASNVFRITLLLGVISLGAYHIISLINSQKFFGHAMISTILFYSFVVVAFIFMNIFDIKRYKLLDEVFGKVDDTDKEIAKNLLCRIKEADIGEFSFLNYEYEIRLEHESFQLKLCLKQIIKGHKIYFGLVKDYFELFEEIKDKVDSFTSNDMLEYKYLTELIPLLERNNQNQI